MHTKAQVINERLDSYLGKRGKVEQHIIACLDLDATHPLLNTFDFVLSEDEAKQHSGKIQGKKVELGIIGFEPAFGGRMRAKGQILGVS